MPLNELPQILNQHYLERSLSQTDFDGQSYSDVKSLKHTTLAKHGYGQSKTWPEVLESFHPTSTESAQENTLAYTLSMGMEHVGMLLTSGAIPLLPTFQLAGVQLAADWSLCQPVVSQKLREEKTLTFADQPEVELHRVHAEWAGLVAYFMVQRHFAGSFVEQLQLAYQKQYPDPKQRLQTLNQSLHKLMPKETKAEVLRWVGFF
ncbi:MAG TPA: hypothetical protein DCR93_37035 [Cytophagales bacterium]|nr:hypothetical protein [Cytophagales bacterium]